MKVSVYSLKKTHFDGEAVSVNCKTAAGEITILDHHRPLISELSTGTMTIVDKNQKSWYISASSGFLEMGSENRLTVLVDET